MKASDRAKTAKELATSEEAKKIALSGLEEFLVDYKSEPAPDGLKTINRDDFDIRFAKDMKSKNADFDVNQFKNKRGIPHKIGTLHERDADTEEVKPIVKTDAYPDEF